jgi:hypothetical protein
MKELSTPEWLGKPRLMVDNTGINEISPEVITSGEVRWHHPKNCAKECRFTNEKFSGIFQNCKFDISS